MKLQTVVLLVAVLPAKGVHAADHALISEHDSLPDSHSSVYVCPDKCKPIPHMDWVGDQVSFVGRVPGFFGSQIPSDRFDMHLHAAPFLNEPLAVVDVISRPVLN